MNAKKQTELVFPTTEQKEAKTNTKKKNYKATNEILYFAGRVS